MNSPAVITNKFAGRCNACRNTVEAGRGLAVRSEGRWFVLHNGGCHTAKKAAETCTTCHTERAIHGGLCEDCADRAAA